MTSSKFVSEGDTTGDLPPLQKSTENGVEEDDDEGFQTVVSKRSIRLLQQQQQQYQNNQICGGRKGNGGGGYGHHGYGNGNGRHYHRNGPPSSNHSSNGTNSTSSGSSIPEEPPKEKEPQVSSDHDQKPESHTPPQTATKTIVPAPSPKLNAWARVAAGNGNSLPPKPDVPHVLNTGSDQKQAPESTDTHTHSQTLTKTAVPASSPKLNAWARIAAGNGNSLPPKPDVPLNTGPSSNDSSNWRPPELSDDKWPLPDVSNSVSEEASKKKKENKKASKPKWVPLILEDEQPKPPQKPNKKITRSIPQQHRNGDLHGGAIGGDESRDCITPTEGNSRSKGQTSGSGPNRNNTGRHNGSKGGGKHRNYHNNHYKFYKETSDPSQVEIHPPGSASDDGGSGDVVGNGEEGYSEYPPEYTAMNALYPLTEFVMPYANFATYSPPPGGPDAQSYSFAPAAIDDAVLTQMIQNQIEYYFSEENLERDFYMRRKMDSDGFIPISLISSFYRIQSMTQDYNVVLNAIKASELIEVREDEDGSASARPVESPTRWPIVDPATASIPPPPPIVKTFLTTINPNPM